MPRLPSPAPLTAVLLLAPLLAAGCASPDVDRAVAARTALLGLSEQGLRDCAGEPQRVLERAGGRQLVYSSDPVTGVGPRRPDGVDVLGGEVYTGSTRYGLSTGAPLGAELSSELCEARFAIVDGRVADVSYRAPGGFRNRPYAACGRFLASCLARARAPEAGFELPP